MNLMLDLILVGKNLVVVVKIIDFETILPPDIYVDSRFLNPIIVPPELLSC